MKVPLSWLKEFVEIARTPDEVAHLLTFAGLEVEDGAVEAEGFRVAQGEREGPHRHGARKPAPA